MKFALAALLVFSAGVAQASNPEAFVVVTRCVSVDSQGVVTSTYLIGGTKPDANGEGSLAVSTRNFEVNGAKRILVNAEFFSKTGEFIRSKLSADLKPGTTTTDNSNCETSADVGKLGMAIRLAQ